MDTDYKKYENFQVLHKPGDLFYWCRWDAGDEKWEIGYTLITGIWKDSKLPQHWVYNVQCWGGMTMTGLGIVYFQEWPDSYKEYLGNVNDNPTLRILYGKP